jgi:hypothetical protein
MKTRTKQFVQNLYHDIENEDRAEAFLDESLPLVGLVVMYFNSLEKSLDSSLCEIISDRTEAPGLIVIQKLTYSAKLDLFKRFSEDFHLTFGETWSDFDRLLAELAEVASLRNLVVHADWGSTDHEGYTFVRLKMSKNGMLQEYAQLTVESLEKVIERTSKTHHSLSDYWEWRSECMANHFRKMDQSQ